MFVRSYKEAIPVSYGKGVSKRVAIGPKQGAPNFVLRVFELEPGVSTPFHAHDWEHEVFILSGEGALVEENKETPLKPNDAVLIPPSEKHCLTGRGQETFRFICVVPLKGEDTP